MAIQQQATDVPHAGGDGQQGQENVPTPAPTDKPLECLTDSKEMSSDEMYAEVLAEQMKKQEEADAAAKKLRQEQLANAKKELQAELRKQAQIKAAAEVEQKKQLRVKGA